MVKRDFFNDNCIIFNIQFSCYIKFFPLPPNDNNDDDGDEDDDDDDDDDGDDDGDDDYDDDDNRDDDDGDDEGYGDAWTVEISFVRVN